jgi:predicted nucleic acid-binding Zn ribbon protein
MPVGGIVGLYFVFKHNFFPENICVECSEVIEPQQDYCSNCGNEVGETNTKVEYLNQLLRMGSNENTESERVK